MMVSSYLPGKKSRQNARFSIIWSGGQTRRGKSSAVERGRSNRQTGGGSMRLMGLSGERAAAALAAAFGIANVLFQAAGASSDRSAPEAVLAIAGALAPTLAI